MAFVRTMYTALETVGSVEVCVNLTHPPIDILDEFVRTEVLNEPNSVYIPENSTLASKQIKVQFKHCHVYSLYLLTRPISLVNFP